MGKPVNSITAQQYRQMQQYKDPKKQSQGRRNRDRGRQFEELIEDSCDFYRVVKEADIEKTPEPMKVLKSLGSGRFICCFEKKAQPDFNGVITGGRMVSFDAKHTDTDQMKQGVISSEQEKSLNRKQALGATCFVVVGFRMTNFYRIPWDVWKDMKTIYGRRYIRPEDVVEYRIKIGQSGKLLFLD